MCKSFALFKRSGRGHKPRPAEGILIHIGEPAIPPRIAPARALPDWLEADFDQTYPNESEAAEPVREFEFDQTVSW